MNKKDKAKKVNLTKIVAGTLATTALLESCVKEDYGVYYSSSSVQDINKSYKNLSDEYPYAVLNIPITAEGKNYLDFVNYLLVDILRDPQNAVRFTENSASYVAEAGFGTMAVKMEDDDLLRMVVALADNEIRKAALNNDVANFLRLCKEKQVFKSINSNGGLFMGLNPDAQVMINAMCKNNGVENVVATIAIAAVVLSTNYCTTDCQFQIIVLASSIVTGYVYPQHAHEFVLQLWHFNGGNPTQTYVLLSEYEQQQINLTIEALQQTFPEKFENVNIDNLRQLITLNIQKSLK